MTTSKHKILKTFILIIGIITGLASVVLAQDQMTVIGEKDEMQTLFGYDAKITGYGAIDTKFTFLNEKEAAIIGGHGGVIFNRYFYFGIGAYGSLTTTDVLGTSPEETLDMRMGYTGLMMGFNIWPKKVVHLSVPLFVGVGNLELEHNNAFVENSVFLVFEPGMLLEINVTPFMKIGLGGGYRLINGTNLRNPIEDGDLTNWSGNFTLAFGNFR